VTHVPTPRPHLIERAVQTLGPTLLGGRQAAVPPAGAPPPPPPPSAPLPPAPIGLEALHAAGLAVGSSGVSRSRVGEELGVIHQAMLRTMRGLPQEEQRASRAVLVTSARPGEGKSFTALNLAAATAAGGSPTLLVDVDGKRGSLTELLGVADAPGLRTLVADPRAAAVAALVRPTAEPRLSILPYGAVQPGGPPVLPAQMITEAVLRIAAALPGHVIILDSPPCLATSEPSALAAVAGQVLMVVEAERTQRAEVEAALDLVDACPVLQLVLNRARLVTGNSFGGYGGYGTYASPSGS
jgi:receptor protein-tyrosine kinase